MAASGLWWCRATTTPLIDLATAGDVRRYLRGRRLTDEAAGRAAGQVPVPLRLTKRGALIWARKPLGGSPG